MTEVLRISAGHRGGVHGDLPKIAVTSAYAANAVSVAEFAVTQIVLSAKRAWSLAALVRAHRASAAAA